MKFKHSKPAKKNTHRNTKNIRMCVLSFFRSSSEQSALPPTRRLWEPRISSNPRQVTKAGWKLVHPRDYSDLTFTFTHGYPTQLQTWHFTNVRKVWHSQVAGQSKRLWWQTMEMKVTLAIFYFNKGHTVDGVYFSPSNNVLHVSSSPLMQTKFKNTKTFSLKKKKQKLRIS